MICGGLIRCAFAVTCIAGSAAAQYVPLGIVRGTIRESDAKANRGTFLMRTLDGQEFECGFDERTWFESQKVRVSIGAFQPNDPVEALLDRRLSGPHRKCYARTIRLREPDPRPAYPRRLAFQSVTEHIVARGNLSFTGVVMKMTGEHLTVRTRADGPRIFVLRADTRFLEGGVPADRSRLNVNQRIFVRAGNNFEGDVEVYQIIWGDITPSR